jgi:hypothetical protein
MGIVVRPPIPPKNQPPNPLPLKHSKKKGKKVQNLTPSLSLSQGPQIYQSKFGPTYRVSYGCSVGLLVGCILMILSTWYLVWRRDLKQKQKEREELGSADVVNVNVNVEDGKTA